MPKGEVKELRERNEELEAEVERLKNKADRAVTGSEKDQSLDDMMYVYRRRDPGTIVLRPITMLMAHNKADGSLTPMAAPGSKSIKIAFKMSEPHPEYRARFMLDVGFAAAQGSTVKEIKDLLEDHSQFTGLNPDIVLVVATKDKLVASKEMPSGKGSGPKLISGAVASGDQGR
jgi:hypothetical protein